ncbi:hypothetical protein KBY97_05955 [Synechococcus sp. ATX 2A4]|uniref:sulfotransferase n=1 Tax=Synechococcus sp. ATX 2A4 TaxID=2823727 RepID=UPI0020CEA691|nr:sulfotransferase [Synechococcus sp. ATX 2A4]MCP9884669.1 hypothetical protein [Synechococcus sp. ATX 2A4]
MGFKLLTGQAPALLAQLLDEAGVKKVLLRRRSRLRAYISLLRARATGSWSNKSYSHLPVSVEPQSLLEFAQRYDDYYAELRAATLIQPVREVIYEDLLADPAELQQLLAFL